MPYDRIVYRHPYEVYRMPVRIEKHYHAPAPAPVPEKPSEKTEDVQEIKRRFSNLTGMELSDEEARAQIRGGMLEKLRLL